MNAEAQLRTSTRLDRVLIVLAASVVLEIVAQCLPPRRSPIFETESALAVGRYGVLETVSLCLRGGSVFLLLRAAATALPGIGALGTTLLAYAAAAKFVIAFVATDLGPRPTTTHGVVHAVFAFTSLFAAATGELLVSRELPAELAQSGLLQLARLTLLWTFLLTAFVPFEVRVWGLLERIETALVLTWLALFASSLRRFLRSAKATP